MIHTTDQPKRGYYTFANQFADTNIGTLEKLILRKQSIKSDLIFHRFTVFLFGRLCTVYTVHRYVKVCEGFVRLCTGARMI